MEQKKVIIEKKDKIAQLTLNEPKSLNALTKDLKQNLMNALEEIEKDEQIKCVILTGAGRAFCAGGDVKAMQEEYHPQNIQNSMDLSRRIIKKIRKMPKIFIAAVHGYATGAGVSLALASDVIFAEKETKFILSFKNVGLIPDLGLHYHLPRKLGYWKAKEWMWSGKLFTAAEAVEYGFAMDEVEKEKGTKYALQYAGTLLKGPINSYIHSKLLINQSYELTLDQVMERENSLQTIIRGTEEHQKFLTSFFNRRK